MLHYNALLRRALRRAARGCALEPDHSRIGNRISVSVSVAGSFNLRAAAKVGVSVAGGYPPTIDLNAGCDRWTHLDLDIQMHSMPLESAFALPAAARFQC